MGGFKWIRKKLQKVNGVRKGIFGGKKQKEERFTLLDQDNFEDDLDCADIETAYRSVIAAIDLVKTDQDKASQSQPKALPNANATQILKKAGATQILKKAGETQVLKKAGETQVLKKAGETQVLKKAGETRNLKKAGATQILKKAGATQILKKAGETQILKKGVQESEAPKDPGQESIDEAMELLNPEYTFEGSLGSGTYGNVCQLFHKTTEQHVAAKIVLKHEVGDYEVDLWATLEHPHILPLFVTVETANYRVFLSPLMEGNLEGAVKSRKLTFSQLRHYVEGAFQGLKYLHANGMCHLDVKGNNVLIGGGKGILCDFGFLAPQNLDLDNECVGMPDWFRPPEASMHYGWEAPIPTGQACDQWGCGIMLMELFSDFPLMRAKPKEGNWLQHVCPVLIEDLQVKEFEARVHSFYSDVDGVTALLLHNLIMEFLEVNPSKRSTVEMALYHDFFEEQ